MNAEGNDQHICVFLWVHDVLTNSKLTDIGI